MGMKTIEEMIVSDTDRRLADTIKEVILAVSIFSEAVDVIFTVHDYSSGTLVLVSKAFTELTGIRQEDIKRGGLQVYHDMIHPKDFDLLGAAYKKSCELFTRKKKKELSYFVFMSNFRIKTVEGDYRQMDNYGVPVL
ncbi:MAG: PAS domain-containing protein, partial [Proteiniphilum sp.]|nr:PAS domain-containing protein [Proteiniphilum sp.]